MALMAYPPELLADGEQIEFEMRPHWRALVAPTFIIAGTLILLVGLFSVSSGWFEPGSTAETIKDWVFVIGGIAVVGLFAVRQLVYWYSSQYVFTDRRIIVRNGIIAKSGRDMPLSKVQNVSYRIPALGRLMKYGSLVIDSASDESLLINDVTDVEFIQKEVTRLADADQHRRMREHRSPDN